MDKNKNEKNITVERGQIISGKMIEQNEAAGKCGRKVKVFPPLPLVDLFD